MIQFPVIKAKYHAVPVDNEGIYLMAENEKHVLEGNTLMQMVPLMDGTRTWGDIVALLTPSLGAEAVSEGINILTMNGHVEEANPSQFKQFQIYWSELGLSPLAVQQLMQSVNVHVVPVGQVDTKGLFQGLQVMGFNSDPARQASITIAVVEDYEMPELEALNARMLAHGTPWLIIKPHGLTPCVGPFFRPGHGPCWNCLASWMRHNREVETYLRGKTGQSDPLPITRARVPLGETQSISIALLQMARWIARAESPLLEGHLLMLDTLSGEQYSHNVLRRPQCPACGDPESAHVGGQPVVLGDPQQRVDNENGVRPEDPITTFNKYAHLISPITGIVKGVFPGFHDPDAPIKTFVAGHNFALKNDNIYFLKDGLRTNSSGKGKTEAQARTSALCEALERYCGTFRREEEVKLASFKELGNAAVNPRDVMLYSDAQYESYEEWNARGARFQTVPLPFDEDAQINWSPVWSWTDKKRKWLPTSLEYYGFDEGPEKFFCWADSNGCAAGGNLEDALLQGALEVVERDSVGIWWMNMLQRPGLDLDSFNDPYIDTLRQYFKTQNREFWVLDLTADTGIPCFAAINRRLSGPTEDIIMGFGAHLDARIALSRAVTEMNQFIPAVLNVGEDGTTNYFFEDPEALHWWKTATLENQPYLRPSKGKARRLEDFKPKTLGSVRENVLKIFGEFEALGLEVLILDQTRPDIGLPVAKVIVPGMRHFWARYAPGRLYDVPVKMGWLKKPKAEADLNPIAMFI